MKSLYEKSKDLIEDLNIHFNIQYVIWKSKDGERNLQDIVFVGNGYYCHKRVSIEEAEILRQYFNKTIAMY